MPDKENEIIAIAEVLESMPAQQAAPSGSIPTPTEPAPQETKSSGPRPTEPRAIDQPERFEPEKLDKLQTHERLMKAFAARPPEFDPLRDATICALRDRFAAVEFCPGCREKALLALKPATEEVAQA